MRNDGTAAAVPRSFQAGIFKFLHIAAPSGRIVPLIGPNVVSEQGGPGINRNSKRNQDIRVQTFSERMIVSLTGDAETEDMAAKILLVTVESMQKFL